MPTASLYPQNRQIIVTLEAGAEVSDIKRAVRLMRGVSSVRMARPTDDASISPALSRQMQRARKEYASRETISCATPEEMQRYFDSL